MANQNIRTPRFYIDEISYLLSRGVAQNGQFDVVATGGSGATATRGIQTGSEAELFDMRPLNKVDFDTSGDPDSQVLITIDTQSATSKKSYVAILNHNLFSAVGKIRIFAGNISSDVASVDGTAADTADIDWSAVTTAEVVNADAIAETGISDAAYDDRSVVIEPAANGTTIVTFPETNLRYWGIQFEGKTSDTSATHHDGTWGSTDLFVGGIMLGEYFELRPPDLAVQRSIAFDNVNIQESVGGQRYSNMSSHGRQATTTTRSPFVTGSYQQNIYGGRLSFDMNFSYLASTDVMPNEYGAIQDTDDAVVQDIWNKTNGPHLPFIFSVDKDSAGANAESEMIFARFGQNNIDMSQVALDTWNISMRIEEEF